MKNTQQNSAGFTLVELAISLAIIGLLLGGVLMGDELLQNARVTRMGREIVEYQGAVAAFRTTYDALPGDMTNPSTRLPNCSTAPCNGIGNGDWMVGGKNDTFILPIGVTDVDEGTLFWRHLAAADLLTPVPQTKTSFYVMKSSLGGAVAYVPNSFEMVAVPGTTPGMQGVYLLAFTAGTNNKPTPEETPYAMTTTQAAMFDRKFDDGRPFSGLAVMPVTGSCTDGTSYLEQDESAPYCNLLFKLIN